MRLHFRLLISLIASGQVLFKSDTSLVNILATVHDDEGRVVRGLTKDDFRLEEDARPREIHDFAAHTDLPLTLALLVDTSASMRPVLDYEQQASVAFLKDALRPGQDRATLFHFDSEVKMLCALEGSAQELARAVHRIKPASSDGPVSRTPHRTTALYGAIVEASLQFQQVSGRKAMIVLTDGLDAGSNHSLSEAVESALRSETAVCKILIPSPVLPRSLTPSNARRYQAIIQGKNDVNLAKGRAVLGKISMQTGGNQFEATPGRSVKSIYAEITDELRSQYRIGMSCGGEGCTPGYHSLSLVTKISGQIVQSRQGFFSGDQEIDSSPGAEALLRTARRLAMKQQDSPVGFVADENVECRQLGKQDARLACSGTAKIVFDQVSRTVHRQVNLSAGATLRIVGATSFGEFSVELPNVFRSLSLQQFHPAARDLASPSGPREFDFLADADSSAWQVWNGERWLTIPYVGVIWIDPTDGSLHRLRRTSTRLPPEMPVSLIQSNIEFSSISMLPLRTTERICGRGGDPCIEISSVVQSYSP